MNPKNNWNPGPNDPSLIPFRSSLTHQEHKPYMSSFGSDEYKNGTVDRFPTTEMHYPRYQYSQNIDRYSANTGRNAVNGSDIYRDQDEYAWSGRGRFTSPKVSQTQRTGASRVYRKVEPPSDDAIAYHSTMYPPRYADMWDYLPELHDAGYPGDTGNPYE